VLKIPAFAKRQNVRWATYKKPTAQTAHLFFSTHKANALKIKKSVSFHRTNPNKPKNIIFYQIEKFVKYVNYFYSQKKTN
jgi:hypothetical protein